jgi:hypothetical protein
MNMSRVHTTAIAKQNRYAARSRVRNADLIVPEAFVRGIRHLGYQTNVEALAELVDNSIQAYAEAIDIVFSFQETDVGRTPSQIAIIDDGHGMDPAMMRIALMWGGTHRENDREGLGRFGYGLPCAAVSIGRRFTIYSKTKGHRLHAVSLDVDAVASSSGLASRKIAIPAAQPAILPPFLRRAIRQAHPAGWRAGTIIVIDNLDRLDWSTASGLKRNLIRRFGVTYHKLLSATRLTIDETAVRPIDPLFLNPDAELIDLDEDRAVALDPVSFKLHTSEGRIGEVVLRYAWIPPSFAAADKSRDAVGLNANARFPIIKQYHGVIFSRNGRLLAVQPRTPWTIFMNNDRYIRVEVEFSAALDEAFGVTTSKQQVSVSPEMWDYLRVAGLNKAIEHLRTKVREAKSARLAQEPLVAPPSTRITPQTRISRTSGIPRGITPAQALAILLDEIDSRSSASRPAVQAAYRGLLNGWLERMGSSASTSRQSRT